MKFFVESVDGNLVKLNEEDFHHLTRVLRVREGERVQVCDGEFDYECEYEGGGLRVARKTACESENGVNITVFQGVPKSAKMESIIQMCSELGVNRIIPFKSRFCVADLPDEKKLHRWRKIAKESAMQCGRDRVMEVSAGVGFFEAVELAKKECDFSFVAYEGEKEYRLADFDVSGSVGFFVGSEGGFSAEEIEKADLPTVSLGRRILRTQTVAPIVSGIILSMLGEM